MHPEKLRALCAKLSEVSKKHKLIVVPGGGEFADVVRKIDKRFNLSAQCFTSDGDFRDGSIWFFAFRFDNGFLRVNQLENVQKILDLDKLPIFLPSNFMLNNDPLENSWDVTSDSIAAYIASQLHIRKLF